MKKSFKKVVSLLLILVMIFLLASCGSDEKKEDKQENAENKVESEDANVENEDVNVEVNEKDEDVNVEVNEKDEDVILNSAGIKFEVDTTVTGEINKNAEPLDSSKIIIAGKTYSAPFKVSEFHANGWDFPEGRTFERQVDPNSSVTLLDYRIYNDEDVCISPSRVTNDTAEAIAVQDCIVGSFRIGEGSVPESFECLLPGGITYKSTAADVISVFGVPGNAPDFARSDSLAAQLIYAQHKTTNITYQFAFNPDGTIYSIYISY